MRRFLFDASVNPVFRLGHVDRGRVAKCRRFFGNVLHRWTYYEPLSLEGGPVWFGGPWSPHKRTCTRCGLIQQKRDKEWVTE